MQSNSPKVGDRVTCAETGEEFTIAEDGNSFNYALSAAGEILSDAGAVRRKLRAIESHSTPVGAYVACDGAHMTTWKGAILGTIVSETVSRNGFHRSEIWHYRVRDKFGHYWYGAGAGRSMCIILRPCRG